MSDLLILSPSNISPSAFVDSTPHRASLASAYNSYTRITRHPSFPPSFLDEAALFYPLFVTSFLIDDFLKDESCFGVQTHSSYYNSFIQADRVIISSASSKTALILAYLLHSRGIKTIGITVSILLDPQRSKGLTSKQNLKFVSSLPFYSQVPSYDQFVHIGNI